MKKALTLVATLAVLTSASVAQNNAKRMTEKDRAVMTPAAMFKSVQKNTATQQVTTPISTPKSITSFPWFQDFEGDSIPGFTFIDADGDSFCWIVTSFGTYGLGHNGSDRFAASASWDNVTSQALAPDNWLILPAFNIPDTGTSFELSWYEKAQDENYSLENYSVYISTTGATIADFGTTPVLTSTTTNEWTKKVVSIGEYAGQTIYIAFRHHNVTDMYYLDIDDIRIGNPTMPEVSVEGPAFVILGSLATFTAHYSTTSVTWYIDGNVESATGSTLTHTFTTAGSHEVVVMASNVVGSVYDTITVNVVDCNNAISEFPYTEGFEGSLNPCWMFVSADPVNDIHIGVTALHSHVGSHAFAFSSYDRADDYNQFLISPELDLPEGDYMVGFWYNGNTTSDAFRVRVSTSTNDTADFTTVLGDFPTVNTDWTYVAFHLPANTKYIAINYYGDYAYYLWVDEFSITEMEGPVVHLNGDTHIGTGMEATYVANISLADTVEWYVDGDAVVANGYTMNYIFTTAGNHEVVVTASNNYGEVSDTLVVDVFSCDNIEIPYIPDFTTGLGCWTNRSDLEADYGWFASVDMFDDDPEGGQILSMSAQNFFGIYIIDADVDNWLISPLINMPETGTYEVAWSVKPFYTEYPGDHYGVYLIQDADTTLLYEETLNSSMTDFVPRAIAIPASVNGDFRIAFRHHDNVGGYVIIIDDIQVRELSAPAVSITGPDFVEMGVEVTFTATSGTADSYAWSVDGNATGTTGNVLTYTFATAGNHTVSVTGTNVVGTGAPATMNVEVMDCAISTLPYTQGFEDASIKCWVIGEGFSLFNDPEYASLAHSGDGFLVGTYDDFANCDQWFISPVVNMPANASGIVFGYYVALSEYDGVQNEYEVRVSTTGSNPADFTTVIKHEIGATNDYVYRGASLENFAGQSIRIAIRNITPAGGDAILFDDITIGPGETTGIGDVANANVRIYPNPVSSVLNIEGEGIEQVEVMDLNGRIILTTAASSINIENLASGVYMVRVTTAEGTHVEKIVKK